MASRVPGMAFRSCPFGPTHRRTSRSRREARCSRGRFSRCRRLGCSCPTRASPLARTAGAWDFHRGTSYRGAAYGGAAYFGWPMMVFYAPEPFAADPAQPEPPPKPVEPPALGRLILDIAPATAQIFVDGYYVGVPEDFSAGRGGGLLAAGPHHIDISADRHEPVAVELMISAGHPVTYRAALKGFPPPAAVPPTTFYLIPGCYMGNIPPKDAHLPPTCDQARAVTWKP